MGKHPGGLAGFSLRFFVQRKGKLSLIHISHFDNVPGLLYLAYVRRGLDIEEGKGFVKNKLERSFQKLSDLSKEFYWDKYNKIMEILE